MYNGIVVIASFLPFSAANFSGTCLTVNCYKQISCAKMEGEKHNIVGRIGNYGCPFICTS